MPKLYYLDDEKDLTELFEDWLKSDKYEIRTFNDPALAIREVNRDPPDIFFVDFQMPGTSGEKVASAISPSIHKVLVTGNIEVAPSAKFAKVIFKPIDFEALQAYINEHLGV